MQLAKLQRGSLPQIVTAYGSVQADPSARQTIMAPLSALVGEIFVRTGEQVAAGAPLIRLGPTPQAAAAYAQARSALRAASQLVDRTRTMLAQHLATAQQLADAVKAQADARASLAELEAEGAGGAQILRAPFPAIVTAISTSPGAIVAQGAALLELDRPNALVLEVGVVPEPGGRDPAQATRSTIVPLGEKERRIRQGRCCAGASSIRERVSSRSMSPCRRARSSPARQAKRTSSSARLTVMWCRTRRSWSTIAASPYVVQAVDMVAQKGAGPRPRGWRCPGRHGRAARSGIAVVLAGNYQLDDGMRVRVAAPDGASAK